MDLGDVIATIVPDAAPGIKACCLVAENLTTRGVVGAPDKTVTVCRVCACRHFRMTADPVLLGVRGVPLE